MRTTIIPVITSLLAVIHPSLQGKEVATRLDHYGLSASVARVSRFASLRNADKGTDVLAAFGLARD